MDSRELMAQAQAICQAAKCGIILYSQAKTQVIPILGIINKRGKQIAKKYGIQYKPITFTSLIR